VALVAHDNTKADLLKWAVHNRDLLSEHDLFTMEMTGRIPVRELNIEVTMLQSRVLGGDQQIGSRITEGSSTS
jgi:methylglyoxal synthase